MSDAHLTLPTPNDFSKAKHQFMELYGSTAVMNTYLKLLVLALVALCAGVTWHDLTEPLPEPIVIRIDEFGRATGFQASRSPYQPREPEIKHFLIQFVQQHYGRRRATLESNYARSLYFLDGSLAEDLMQANHKDKRLEPYLSGQSDEIDVQVDNVVIEPLREPPYRATLYYQKIHFRPGTHEETKREKFVGTFDFLVNTQVANAMIPVNPLGLTITHFREDQSFQ